jgi:hypothetical protein
LLFPMVRYGGTNGRPKASATPNVQQKEAKISNG